MTTLPRLLATASLAFGAVFAAPGAFSQAGPAASARLIVPTTPGATPDILARLLADRIAPIRPIVENRPGATGLVGNEQLARASADGNTIGLLFMGTAIAQQLLANPPVDVARDLAPVTRLVWSYNVLVVPASSPMRTLQDVLAAARREPGKLTFASGGNGTPAHVIGEFFKRTAGISMLHVPFKGPTPAVFAVTGEQVNMMFSAVAAVASGIRQGRLRAIVVTSPARLSSFPEIPTSAESGMPDLVVRDWIGLVAPKRTSEAMIGMWRSEFAKALASPGLDERLTQLGLEAAPSSPAEFGVQIERELQRWKAVIKEANLTAD